jgi:hypothetical protein
MSVTGAEKVTAKEVANILSLTDRHVRRLASENVLSSEPSPKGQLFVLATAVSEFIDYVREDEATTPEGEQLKVVRREVLEVERDRKRLLLAQEKQELVKTEAVKVVHSADYARVRQALDALQVRLLGQCRDEALRQIIEQEISSARHAMSARGTETYFEGSTRITGSEDGIE